MGIENIASISANESNKPPKKIEELMPFLQQTEEEKEYNRKVKDATNLLSSDNFDDAMMAISQVKREKKPDEREISQDQEIEFYKNRESIAKALGYNVTTNNGKFLSLEKEGYRIQMKHFMLPVSTGVNAGRISAIQISKEGKSATWDNGWIKEPKDEGIKKIFEEIVDFLS